MLIPSITTDLKTQLVTTDTNITAFLEMQKCLRLERLGIRYWARALGKGQASSLTQSGL